MSEFGILTSRAVYQIDNIIIAVYRIIYAIFRSGGFLGTLVDTILGNDYLLISVSLLLLGFVVGLISRLIRV